MRRICYQHGWPLLLILLLTGCRIDLYKGLSEQEANQMLALLMINRITAQKVNEQGGTLKIRVDQADFVNAVEILRQTGYPKRQYLSVNDLFPANQLVTSPQQEQAKLTHLKEQRLEQLISAMEGVVSASVIIAEPPPAENRRDVVPPSAAVLVKYSPETSMAHFINQIKSLVYNSIPGISYEAVTVVLQAANYRFLQLQIPQLTPASASATTSVTTSASAPAANFTKRVAPEARRSASATRLRNPWWILLGGAWAVLLIAIGAWYWRRRRHKATVYADHSG